MMMMVKFVLHLLWISYLTFESWAFLITRGWPSHVSTLRRHYYSEAYIHTFTHIQRGSIRINISLFLITENVDHTASNIVITI